MSTCHQAHNIPWGTLLEVLHQAPTTSPEYFERHGIYNLQDLVFTPDPSGHVFNKLKFFARKVEGAIHEFLKTERQKYNNSELDQITETCSKDACNEWLEKWQDMSSWEGVMKGQSDYGCLEAIKELFIQEKAASLLGLARKGFKFENYSFVTYSNFFHYGIGRIKEDCLTLYIHLNLLLATGTLQEPQKWHGQWHLFLDREILTSYDGNSHARMYKDYFVNNPKFEDLDGMQNLLKKLFRTMYLYDMIMTERGRPVAWEEEVLSCLAYFLDRTRATSSLYWDQREQNRKKTEDADK